MPTRMRPRRRPYAQARGTGRRPHRLAGGLVGLAIVGALLYARSAPPRLHHERTILAPSAGPQPHSLPPGGYTIKGNISVTTGEKLYHVPGMRDYDRTVIDISRGERWFRTEAEAQAAGWHKAGPR